MKLSRQAFGSLQSSVFSLLCGVGLAAVAAPGCSSGNADVTSDGSGGTAASGGSGGSTTGGSGGTLVSGGSSGNGGSSGSGGSGGETCGGQTAEAEPVKVNLLLVIDKSGSMDDTPTDFTDSKWDTMVTSLKMALDGIEDQMSVGLQFFPDGDTGGDSCVMPNSADDVTVGVAADAVSDIEDELDSSSPGGDTPAAAALQLAFDYFDSGPGMDLEGENWVLLALDGGPNCNSDFGDGNPDPICDTDDKNDCTHTFDQGSEALCGSGGPQNCCEGKATGCLDDAETIAKVEQLAEAGIKTLVIGIPGSDNYISVLDELAEKGGAPASDTSPKYYKVDDPGALTETLVDLTTGLVTSCELALEENPPSLDRVNVFIDDEVLPQEGDDGWEYDMSTTPPTIVIKGETCADIETNGADSVSVRFGCPTVIVK